MVTSHRLDPLLKPASIAVVGASERHGSVGWRTMENLRLGGYEGALYAVNPGYSSVCGFPCYPDLTSLPETVEHVVLAVGDARIEAALDSVIAHGSRAATMMSSLVLKNDSVPLLRDRITQKIIESGLIVCGANGMGFYNFHDGVWVCGFDTRENHLRGGNVTLISHSGAGMSGIVDCEERIDFNLAVSTGQELCVTMDQYMDYALDQPETGVIGLFMETARRPEALIAAFEKARARAIPVVVLKVGRTEMSARLAVSHSGAIAGRDDTYQALFDRYGVQRVHDMHEMTTALMMFAQPHRVSDGGLVAIHDSGGERQLLIDLAADMGVPLTDLKAETADQLTNLLDPGLPAVNPLDAWGAGGPNADYIMEESLAAMMTDPGAGLGAVVHDRAPLSGIYPEYVDYMRRGHEASGKPVFLVSNHQGSGSDPAAVSATREGMPVLDGLRPFLAGVRCLLNFRDFQARPVEQTVDSDIERVNHWKTKLAGAGALDEYQSSQLLRDFGFPMNPSRLAGDEQEALAAASELGYPVVLKTATESILHKTDQDGVKLGLANAQQLSEAYRDVAGRLGSRVMLCPMIDTDGQEMVLGMIRDEQFGPLVMLGFGGINVESLRDVACALAPFGESTAQRMIDSLQHRSLLDRLRNRPPVDIESFARAAAGFSAMAASLGEVIEEIDINPVIVHPEGCVAVDALVVARPDDQPPPG